MAQNETPAYWAAVKADTALVEPRVRPCGFRCRWCDASIVNGSSPPSTNEKFVISTLPQGGRSADLSQCSLRRMLIRATNLAREANLRNREFQIDFFVRKKARRTAMPRTQIDAKSPVSPSMV